MPSRRGLGERETHGLGMLCIPSASAQSRNALMKMKASEGQPLQGTPRLRWATNVKEDQEERELEGASCCLNLHGAPTTRGGARRKLCVRTCACAHACVSERARAPVPMRMRGHVLGTVREQQDGKKSLNELQPSVQSSTVVLKLEHAKTQMYIHT